METSEMLRSIVSYFMMSYTLGQWKMPMQDVRKEFLKYMNDIGKYQKRPVAHKHINRENVMI